MVESALSLIEQVDSGVVDNTLKRIAEFQELINRSLVLDRDYGVIPGTGKKPSLLKPGAEKINMLLQTTPEYEFLDRTVDFKNGFFNYEVRCTLYKIYHIDNVVSKMPVSQGVGSCNNHEKKYKYITVTRTQLPPDVDVATLPYKKDSYGNTKYYILNPEPADLANCVTPDTLILTHDLRWVKAGEIKTGDMLVGVEENLTNEYARHFSIGKATVHGRRTDLLYELTMEDGRKVRCNGEHKWLVKKIGLKGTEWVSTETIYREIIERKGRPRKWTIMSVCPPWQEDTSKEAGYLAGLLDADGTLGVQAVIVCFAQQQNTVLDRMKQGLKNRGFSFGHGKCKTQDQLDQTNSGKQVFNMRITGGLPEQMRLLGSIRPPRLMERWLDLVDFESRRLEGRGSGLGKPVEIVSIEVVGEGEIVMLESSCHTYIANGLVCHNTILKMAKKRAYVDATLQLAALSDIFTQDLEDLRGTMPEAPDKVMPMAPTAPASTPASRASTQPRMPRQHNPGTTVLKFGKHNGKMIADVARSDKGYVVWLAENAQNEMIKEDAAAYLRILAGQQAQAQAPAAKDVTPQSEQMEFQEPDSPPMGDDDAPYFPDDDDTSLPFDV